MGSNEHPGFMMNGYWYLPVAMTGGGEGSGMLLTFGGALVFGVFFTLIAHRLRLSPIVVLLLGGIALGPEGLGVVRPEALGDGLTAVISLAVGIVLFEGGLNLNLKGYRAASREIKGLVVSGVLVTWWATALFVWLLFRFPVKICLLMGSLIIVTGPTVIGPLLKRVRVKTKIHDILHWEGVLIDPIGVFIALLCYKIVTVSGDTGAWQALGNFGSRILVGAVVGGVGGLLLAKSIEKRLIPEESLNIFVLAAAIGIFTAADLIIPESGLLSVTIAGFAVGSRDLPAVRKLRAYKAELIEMLIGLLFVLIAARLRFDRFLDLGWRGLALVLLVLFVVRPLVVFLATIRSPLAVREKLFLSWIGPRGMVAISMASLFALHLTRPENNPWESYADSVEAFGFAIVAATVLFQGFTAKGVARLLRVLEPVQTGWLVIGAHGLARRVARFIRDQGFQVALADAHVRATALARRAGLKAICVDPLALDLDEHPELYGIGNVLAISEQDELNALVCQHLRRQQGDLRLYRWSDRKLTENEHPEELLIGEPVWNVLQLSNLRALDLEENQRHLAAESMTSRGRHPERVLMCRTADGLLPYLPAESNDSHQVLVYQPFRAELDITIKPEWLHYLQAATLDDVFTALLQCLRQEYPELDMEAIHTNLIQQEHEYSSLVGYEVALPHFYINALRDSVVLFAKLMAPIKDLHSTEDIRYIFLVLSPENQPKIHLQSLSEISRFIMDEGNRQRLDAAAGPHDLFQVFFEEEERR